MAWGDPILPGAPRFDPTRLSSGSQAGQFGYNCDYVGFLPSTPGGQGARRGLLVVNHEYTNPELMFAGYDHNDPASEQIRIQLEAHGMSVVEVEKSSGGQWVANASAPRNRRVTGTTETAVTGPAAGHRLLRTRDDRTGTRVVGTLANCSAGLTPWGTILSAEENFHMYFAWQDKITDIEAGTIHGRYGLPREDSSFRFERLASRFDLRSAPHEPFRFGWVVELDPYDPEWVPRKRTALGRLRREGAACVVSPGGRVVLYSGDDIVFEYIYKFVTRGTYDPGDRDKNRDLLDQGTLFVARLNHDGTGIWMPLLPGGALSPQNGFESQADICINTAGAADLLHPTQMDRPEDIQVSPTTGKVYVALTHNPFRGGDGYLLTDPANPRRDNRHGHIIEITEQNDDHASTRFTWNIFMLCGDPADPTTYFAGFPRSLVSPISRPDNLTFDASGNMWVATDGQPVTLGANDGLYAVPVAGPERGWIRRFLSAVPGAEICSPRFTPDERTLFASVQHPGEGSTLENPSSVWPDGDIPRPAVVAVTTDDGSPIGRRQT
jgi:secreted PhoX family phosphatase